MSLPKINPKQKFLIINSCISCVLVGMSWPMMHKLIINNISEHLISLEAIVFCATGMICAGLWKKIQKPMLKKYLQFEVFETIALTVICALFIFNWNPVIYWLMDIMYASLIGQWIGQCTSAYKQFLFTESQERIDANNAFSFYQQLACIIGYGIALIYVPSINVALICFWLADIFRTSANVYTFCFKWNDFIQSEMSKSEKKESEEK